MPSERSKPSEMTGEKAARSKVRSISVATCWRPFWTTTSVTGSIALLSAPAPRVARLPPPRQPRGYTGGAPAGHPRRQEARAHEQREPPRSDRRPVHAPGHAVLDGEDHRERGGAHAPGRRV